MPARTRRAFTLMEMMVVMAVMVVLVGLLLPTLASVRAEARSTSCCNNLKQCHAAICIWRNQSRDMLPFAAPLPLAPGQTSPIPSLHDRLRFIMPADSPQWVCPSDFTTETEAIGSSYAYVAGGWMQFYQLTGAVSLDLAASTDFDDAFEDAQQRAARLVTKLYDNGPHTRQPILVDNGDYHPIGTRFPRNGVFIGGESRPLKNNEAADPDDDDSDDDGTFSGEEP